MTSGPDGPVARVELRGERDIAAARLAVTRAMNGMGARTLIRVRFVTAVSEIVRNAIMHGKGGELTVHVSADAREIRVCCIDSGPGIEDIDRALQDGFSTARSLGKGLGGARRLVDRFDIASAPGAGTRIEMTSRL